LVGSALSHYLTWGQRKLALYGLMFGTLLIIQLGSSALIGAAIAAFLSMLAAPEPGSTTKDTLKGAVIFVLRIAGAILIPMSITLAILGLIWLTNPR
jgi:hypothetical protein